jgi:hypothetical protein
MVCEITGGGEITGMDANTPSSELKDKEGQPHKVHLVANLRIDGKRCWGMKIPINSAIIYLWCD